MSPNPHVPTLEEERRLAHSGALSALAGHCARHPWRVIVTWLVVIVALGAMNASFGGKLVDEFKVPGTDFQKATDLINAKFGAQKGSALRVVLAAPEGQRLDTPERRAAVERMLAASAVSQRQVDEDQRDVTPPKNPLAAGSTTFSEDGRIAFFDVQYDRQAFDLERSDVVRLEDALQAAGAPAGIQVEFTGEAEQPEPEQGVSELLGIIAAFLILLVLFRALVPTLIPIVFAIVAVFSAFLLLFLAAALTNFNTVTQILVPMIGLGVGIDYTLFIVTRFRQLLHDGLTPREAAAAAGATAGRAVIFAGLTVAISITGLGLIGIDFITKLGLGSALGVVTAAFYGAYILAVTHLREARSTARIMAVSTTVCAAALLPFAVASGETMLPVTAAGWLVLCGLALVCQTAGQGLIAYAMAHLPASFSSVSLLLQPVMATLYAWVILGERAGPAQFAGGAVILAGIWLARRGR